LVPLLFGLMGGLSFFCLNHLPFATVHVQDITLFDPVVRDVLQVIFLPFFSMAFSVSPAGIGSHRWVVLLSWC
ncbi:MAG: hypothetical protein P8166_11510, partial [Candidatus Thiodiazotropha sp.]